jgi:glycosyltransferase involved in cell wall biosynthesis
MLAPAEYCLIIPTFNNEKTLLSIVNGALKYFTEQQLIVVNDGSTDTTPQLLNQLVNIHLVAWTKNRGKGMALRKGFEKALELGFSHAVTIDSDGQHFPTDIPNLIRTSIENPDTLFIGSRNMQQFDVPGKSSFGNKFSNFWFWFETGIKLSDTQSGFRVYPISIMPKKWYSIKFEFEIECIVRSAWNEIPVKNIPIKIKYYAEGERVSHFRPFKDFSRISVVNTLLVFIQFAYILPRNFVRGIKKKTLLLS